MAKCVNFLECGNEARGNSPTCYECYKAWKQMQNESFDAMKEWCGGFNGETAPLIATGMKRLFSLWETDKVEYKKELEFIKGESR